MKKLLYIFLVLGGSLCAQSISPQVLNAAGSSRPLGNNGATLADNVGEPFTDMLGPASNAIITQGFLQPEVISLGTFSLATFVNNQTCTDIKDGKITTALTTSTSKFKAAYLWQPAGLCPTNDCTGLDSLQAGTYSLTVVFTYTTLSNTVKNDTLKKTFIVSNGEGPCKVKIFTGVTINNDGKNDFLVIENIDAFPNNRLTVYNRWGKQIFDETGYNNTTKIWPSTDEQSKLLASTYFYILDLGDGSKPIKGWLELIKN